jgi:hypothetical protein
MKSGCKLRSPIGSVISDHRALPHLAETDRHIATGVQCVVSQHSVIRKLDRIGCDTTGAKALLATFEGINEFVLHREMILRELSQGRMPARGDTPVDFVIKVGRCDFTSPLEQPFVAAHCMFASGGLERDRA